MDIIGYLTRTVTPAVLGDNHTPQNESLLKQFYALFAAKLADNDSHSLVAGQEVRYDDVGFFDRLWTDETHRNSIANELAAQNNVDATKVNGLVASAAPLAFNEIKGLAGSTPVPQFLRDNMDSYRNHIPSWGKTVLPAGVLGATAAHAGPTAVHKEPVAAPVAEPEAGHRISNTTSTEPLHREEKDNGGFLKALLPIIGLIILAALAWALLKGCQDNPAPVASPEETVEQPAEQAGAVDMNVEPASLALATGEGNQLYSCRINVGNDDLGNTVTSAVRDAFGAEADKCRVDADDNFATDMPAAEHLAALLPIIQQSPNANVIFKGEEVLVNSPDEDTLNQLVEDLKAAAPGLSIMAEGPLDIQGEIDRSINDANAGLDALGENPDPRDVARALSRQVVNFEFDESFIPEVNKPVLDRAVEIMEQVPDMELLIIGHTDAIGTNDYNIPLSQRRAQSIKDYLVEQGADASRLKIKGMGESDPIATNETEQGRFRNRRIEYVVYDESMGAADENGIVVAADSEIRETEVKNKGTDTNNNAGVVDPDLNPTDSNNDDILPDSDDSLESVDPDLNPLDNNNDDVLPDSDDTLLNPEAQ